jgi:hypothetical protein
MNKFFIAFLGLSAGLVSITGAFFSISGLAKLFSGAPLAVMVMAGALELAKIVSASFLHRNWNAMHVIMRTYLSMAVGILMCITSLGIFGYLSFAYQNTSAELKNTMVRIESLLSEQRKIQAETERLQKTVDEIPENRITRKMDTQKELEPRFQALQKRDLEVQIKLRQENLKKLSYQMEIGPVIFVAELFDAKTDSVATWLIIMFVIVFDPLAVCMVLATSFAIKEYEKKTAAMPPPAQPEKASAA